MLTAQTKTDAFAAFLQGQSLREISASMEISRRTLERWSSNEHWVIIRERARRNALSKAREDYCIEVLGRSSTIGNKLFSLLSDAYAQHRLFFEGKIPKSTLRYSIKDISNLAIATIAAVNIELQQATLDSFQKKPK